MTTTDRGYRYAGIHAFADAAWVLTDAGMRQTAVVPREESEMDMKRSAYNVWLCGECDSHTAVQDNGDHLCETCGQLYDHAGQPLADDDE